MLRRNHQSPKTICWSAVTVLSLLAMVAGCSPAPEAPSSSLDFKQLPADAENAGFLSDYSKLKSDPDLDEGVLAYVNDGEMKDLHQYIAIIVDPVEVYIASDADLSAVSDEGGKAAVEYFDYALKSAISDVYAIVDTPGPLVLRLRSALVGVDVGSEVTAEMPQEGVEPLEREVDIGEVVVEFELVDSVTGEVIAAAIDAADIGTDETKIAATHFERMEEFDNARAAFDTWAESLREFLDVKHELTGEDAERADRSYRPY